jgi:endonuclease YncB( thermonuclease family)
MRHLRFVGGAALAAAVLAAILWHGTPPSPDLPPAGVSVPIPATTGDATPAAPAPTLAPIDTTGIRIADRPEAEPAETNKLPRLPSRTVAARPAYVVPEDQPPPPPRPIDIRNPPGGGPARSIPAQSVPAQSAPVQAEPAQPASPESASTQTASTAPPAGNAPPRGAGVQIAGPAEVSGAAALMIFGRPIRLFGVRPPGAADRCAPANAAGAAALPCAEQAHRVLVARLAPNAGVSCRIPAPNAAGAVCLDAQGVDLGGFLVAEGLALADPSQSYDYVGAESIARTQHRGLWLFR